MDRRRDDRTQAGGVPVASALVGTWNLEWARPGTARGRRVAAVLDGLADVLVVTECELGTLPPGHVVDAGTDWGYRLPGPDRRKVALWSRHPWTSPSSFEREGLPPGRLVAATTTTPVGPLHVVGVCIPWRGAHVTTGRQDRRPWEDHESFLTQLAEVVAGLDGPFVLAGDFNQRIPRVSQPQHLAALLGTVLAGTSVPTAGDAQLGRLIDHVALGRGLSARRVELVPQRDEDGPRSDHVGAHPARGHTTQKPLPQQGFRSGRTQTRTVDLCRVKAIRRTCHQRPERPDPMCS